MIIFDFPQGHFATTSKSSKLSSRLVVFDMFHARHFVHRRHADR